MTNIAKPLQSLLNMSWKIAVCFLALCVGLSFFSSKRKTSQSSEESSKIKSNVQNSNAAYIDFSKIEDTLTYSIKDTDNKNIIEFLLRRNRSFYFHIDSLPENTISGKVANNGNLSVSASTEFDFIEIKTLPDLSVQVSVRARKGPLRGKMIIQKDGPIEFFNTEQ